MFMILSHIAGKENLQVLFGSIPIMQKHLSWGRRKVCQSYRAGKMPTPQENSIFALIGMQPP